MVENDRENDWKYVAVLWFGGWIMFLTGLMIGSVI